MYRKQYVVRDVRKVHISGRVSVTLVVSGLTAQVVMGACVLVPLRMTCKFGWYSRARKWFTLENWKL
jgi:hypothetical protein